MLLIEKMTKMDEHIDKVVGYAQIVRAKAQKVGKDILRYWKKLAEIDFSGKIENRCFAFLPIARDMVEEKDWRTFSFLSLYFLFQKQCNGLINIINKKRL
jgi:hypothetical protein